jgi:hypothetical protein
MKTIGVLVSTQKTKPQHQRPLEAVLTEQFNIQFGSKLTETNGTTYLNERPIDAIYDRFPSRILPHLYPDLSLYSLPIFNPPSLNRLCQDKLLLQQKMESIGIPMPEVTAHNFNYFLKLWGGLAIAKPQFGAFGKGVSLVKSPPPPQIPGLNGTDPTLLQAFISPPKNWAGLSVRQLVQRNEDLSWSLPPPVLRCSREDHIVNASRGAEVIPAEELLPSSCREELHRLSSLITEMLSKQPSGANLIELGLDFVIDKSWSPWLIEINSQPKGKYLELAQRRGGVWLQRHHSALEKPFKSILKQIA